MYYFYYQKNYSKVIFFLGFKKISMIYLSTLEERQRETNGQADTQRKTEKQKKERKRAYPNYESDCCTSRSRHDFCTIGDEIKKRGYNGFSAMIKLVSQNCRKMAIKEDKKMLF